MTRTGATLPTDCWKCSACPRPPSCVLGICATQYVCKPKPTRPATRSLPAGFFEGHKNKTDINNSGENDKKTVTTIEYSNKETTTKFLGKKEMANVCKLIGKRNMAALMK